MPFAFGVTTDGLALTLPLGSFPVAPVTLLPVTLLLGGVVLSRAPSSSLYGTSGAAAQGVSARWRLLGAHGQRRPMPRRPGFYLCPAPPTL